MVDLTTYQKAVLTRILDKILGNLEPSALAKNKFSAYTLMDYDQFDVSAMKQAKKAINAKPKVKGYHATKVTRIIKIFNEYRIIIGISAYNKYHECEYSYYNKDGIGKDFTGISERLNKLVTKHKTRFFKKEFTEHLEVFESL